MWRWARARSFQMGHGVTRSGRWKPNNWSKHRRSPCRCRPCFGRSRRWRISWTAISMSFSSGVWGQIKPQFPGYSNWRTGKPKPGIFWGSCVTTQRGRYLEWRSNATTRPSPNRQCCSRKPLARARTRPKARERPQCSAVTIDAEARHALRAKALQLVLENPGNACYANSSILALIWASLSRQEFKFQDWDPDQPSFSNCYNMAMARPSHLPMNHTLFDWLMDGSRKGNRPTVPNSHICSPAGRPCRPSQTAGKGVCRWSKITCATIPVINTCHWHCKWIHKWSNMTKSLCLPYSGLGAQNWECRRHHGSRRPVAAPHRPPCDDTHWCTHQEPCSCHVRMGGSDICMGHPSHGLDFLHGCNLHCTPRGCTAGTLPMYAAHLSRGIRLGCPRNLDVMWWWTSPPEKPAPARTFYQGSHMPVALSNRQSGTVPAAECQVAG